MSRSEFLEFFGWFLMYLRIFADVIIVYWFLQNPHLNRRK